MFHFRSQLSSHLAAGSEPAVAIRRPRAKQDILRTQKNLKNSEIKRTASLTDSAGFSVQSQQLSPRPSPPSLILELRSEERREGKEGGSQCRSRWWPQH